MRLRAAGVLSAIAILAGPGAASAAPPDYVPGSFWDAGGGYANCRQPTGTWSCSVVFYANDCTDGSLNSPWALPETFYSTCSADLAATLRFREAVPGSGTGCVQDGPPATGMLDYTNGFVVPPSADIPVTLTYAAGAVTATAQQYRPPGTGWTYDVVMTFPIECRGEYAPAPLGPVAGGVLATYDGWLD